MNNKIFTILRKKLKEARQHTILCRKIEEEISDLLEELGIDDADAIDTNAENAFNLEEAISCYIYYGEYSIDGLIKEIKAAADR